MRVGKNIAVTNHAVERLSERMKIKSRDVARVVRKAWWSRQPICEEFWKSKFNLKNNGCTTYHYRKHRGCIFCFQKKIIDVVLLTIFLEKPELYEADSKETFKRNSERSILSNVNSAQGEEVWGKDYFRTRYNLRRKTSERKVVYSSSMRKASRSE